MVLAAVGAIALAGCSGGNDAAQQAEVDRLKAETEKLRAEAAQTQQENTERKAEWDSDREVREGRARNMERARNAGKVPIFDDDKR